MMHVPTFDRLRDEFLELYQNDFEITGGGLMESFILVSIGVEQHGKVIRLHLDKYIQYVLDEFQEFINKSLRPKRLTNESPSLIRVSRSIFDHISLNFNFQYHGFALIYRSMYHCWHNSAYPQVHRIGRRCI